tara:strand:+ start:1128 stop:2219 length:1092 start_codon:yes stop_codon:yes gene_type:complete
MIGWLLELARCLMLAQPAPVEARLGLVTRWRAAAVAGQIANPDKRHRELIDMVKVGSTLMYSRKWVDVFAQNDCGKGIIVNGIGRDMIKKVAAIMLSLFGMLIFCEAFAGVELNGVFQQGGMVIGKTTPGDVVWVGDKKVRVSQEGRFVFGFGRDHAKKQTLKIERNGQLVETKAVEVAPREYNIQHIDGLPSKHVSPPESVLKRIRQETALVKAARKTNDQRTDFLSTFEWPLLGPITGVYGSQRVLNGQPKRPHYGLDIAAPVGTLVTAPAPGIITLAHDDMYYSGGTVILDHGHGLSSTFIHLSKVLVKDGDVIKTGDPIAEVGSKGRSTGPHLDWRMNWFNQRLDPALIMGPMPEQAEK